MLKEIKTTIKNFQKKKINESYSVAKKEQEKIVETKKLEVGIIKFKEELKVLKEESAALELYKNFKKVVQYDIFAKKGIFDFTYMSASLRGLFDNSPKVYITMIGTDEKIYNFKAKSILPYFMFREKAYMLIKESMRWNETIKLMELLFHEDIAVPLRFDVPTQAIKDSLKDMKMWDRSDTPGFDGITLAIQPRTLSTFIKSEFLEKINKGKQIKSDIELIKLLQIITVLLAAGNLILAFRKK